MTDHIYVDDLGDKIIKGLGWIMWIAGLGLMSVRLTWTDKRDKEEREFIIDGFL